MQNNEAVQYLESLLGRTLRIHTTDTRMFVGTFKCTDTVGAPFLPAYDLYVSQFSLKNVSELLTDFNVGFRIGTSSLQTHVNTGFLALPLCSLLPMQPASTMRTRLQGKVLLRSI